MFQIMIVDDERIILNGCRMMIQELLKLPFSVDIVTATNVPQAISILETTTPDMILTDIRMPVMDGFELIKHVRENKISSEIVILTSHADFEYARTALRYNVLDFILKPINEVSLRETIMKIHRKLIDEKAEQLENAYLKVLTMLKYEFSPSDLLLTDEMLEEMFPSTYFTVLVVESEQLPDNTFPFQELLMQYYDYCRCYLSDERSQLICICNHDTFFVKPTNLHDKLYQLIGGSFLSGTSISSNSVHKLHQLYTNACQRIFYKKVFGNDENLSGTALFSYQDCIQIFLENNPDKMRNELLKYIERMNLVGNPSRSFLEQIYISFFQNISLYAENSGLEMPQNLDLSLPANVLSPDALADLIIGRILNFRSTIKETSTDSEQLINQLLGFIKNHYTEDISLDDLSSAVNLNSNYICSFFKKSIGQSFLACLHKERLTAAKKLLLETDYTIEEISHRVGYNSSTQFARIFRKYENSSPSDFRSH